MDLFVDIALASVRMATPLCFAALGGILAERAGVVNLALEGLMLMGAFTAAAVAATTGSPMLAFLSAGLTAAALAALLAFLCLHLRGDQSVVGMGINLLSLGLTPLLNKTFFGITSSTPSLESSQKFTAAPTFLLVGLLAVQSLWLRSTRSGLWVQVSGENPAALSSAGIRPIRLRWICILCSGVLAGFGGAALSTMLASQFSRNMTAGSGFMAIAAMILGRWSPLPTAAVCLFFGLTEATQIRLQALLSGAEQVWLLQLVQMLPYVLTLLVLAGAWQRSHPPKALGQGLDG